MTPLHKIEAALIAACGVAAVFRPIDAALAVIAIIAALELMRSM